MAEYALADTETKERTLRTVRYDSRRAMKFRKTNGSPLVRPTEG